MRNWPLKKFQQKRQGCKFRLSTNDSIVMYLSYKLRSKVLGQNLSSSKQRLDNIRQAAIWGSRKKASKIFATGFRLQCILQDQFSNQSCRRSHCPGTAQQPQWDKTRIHRHNFYSLACHLPRRQTVRSACLGLYEGSDKWAFRYIRWRKR
jgi:hypothetical protein